jgi:hypothetical protein
VSKPAVARRLEQLKQIPRPITHLDNGAGLPEWPVFDPKTSSALSS